MYKEGRSRIEVTAIEGLLKLFGYSSIRYAGDQRSVSYLGKILNADHHYPWAPVRRELSRNLLIARELRHKAR